MTKRIPRRTSPTARDLMKEVPALIPLDMEVRDAAAVLRSTDVDAVPVVDSDGRCVGLFSAADFRRWATRTRGKAEVFSDWQIVPPAPAVEKVRHHMTRRFSAANPGAAVSEMLHRLSDASNADNVLVVIDHQRRPQGLVYPIDLLREEAVAHRATGNVAAAK